MTNFNILEELRDKEELIQYFKKIGKNITEEEIYVLKQSYNQAQKNNEALTIQQLDDVAGGFGTYKNVEHYIFGREKAQGLIFKRGLFENDFHAETKGSCDFKNKVVVYDGILGALGIGRVIKINEQNPEVQQKFSNCIPKTSYLIKQMFVFKTVKWISKLCVVNTAN